MPSNISPRGLVCKLLLATTFVGCGNASGPSAGLSAAAAPTVIDTTSILAEMNTVDASKKSAVFKKIRGMSFQTYHKFVAANLTNDQVVIDHRQYSGLKDQWLASQAYYVQMDRQYGSFGAYWHQLGIDPEHATLAHFNLAGDGTKQLSLGDTFFPNLNNEECKKRFSDISSHTSVSAQAIALAYSLLPTKGEPQTVDLVQNDEYGLFGHMVGTQQRAKIKRGTMLTSEIGTENTTFFKDCMKKNQDRRGVFVLNPDANDAKDSIMWGAPADDGVI